MRLCDGKEMVDWVVMHSVVSCLLCSVCCFFIFSILPSFLDIVERHRGVLCRIIYENLEFSAYHKSLGTYLKKQNVYGTHDS